MIDKLEQFKNIMNENDSEIESMYAIILTVAANIIPCTIFIFFYKRIYFLEWDFWKLILISVSVTSPIFMLNYLIINIQTSIRIFSNPNKLANQVNQDIMNKRKNKTKSSNKSQDNYTDNEFRQIIVDELYTTLTTRNKNILYITSKSMLIIFSVTLISFYYLNLTEYLLKHKVLIFLYIELLFFVIPTIVDFFNLKK